MQGLKDTNVGKNAIKQPKQPLEEFNAYNKELSIQEALGSSRTKKIYEVAEIRSSNFIQGVSGWRLTRDGLELGASSGTFPAGSITFTDLQNISTGKLLGRSSASTGSIEQLTPSTGLTLSGGNLTITTAYQRKSLFDHFADAGNVGTGEDDLYSDTIAAGQLANNGEKIEAQYNLAIVSSATATRQIKAYFGGTLILDTTALTFGSAGACNIWITIIRESSSVVRCMVEFAASGLTLQPISTYTRITGLTLANTQILKITGEAAGVGAATDDIVAKMGSVEWKSAA